MVTTAEKQTLTFGDEDLTLFTIEEVAKIFSVTTKTVFNWIYRGEIKTIILPGGNIRIPLKEIKRILEENYGYYSELKQKKKKGNSANTSIVEGKVVSEGAFTGGGTNGGDNQ